MERRAPGIALWQAPFISLGNIIGAGIFVLPDTGIDNAGLGAVLAFVITAILATRPDSQRRGEMGQWRPAAHRAAGYQRMKGPAGGVIP